MNKEKIIKRVRKGLVIGFFALYSLMTLFPFYILIIRTFVPTAHMSELHLWVPELAEFNMDSRYKNAMVFYSLDPNLFKEKMNMDPGIYINPNYTFHQIAEKYQVSEKEIKDFMKPYVAFNGWLSIFTNKNFIKSLITTLYISTVSIVVGSLLGMATGHTLAGFTKRWHLWIFNYFLLQMVISPIMVMLPQYLIITSLGLYNKHLALILLYCQGGALSTMIFTNYYATIPKEIRESVLLDGGGRMIYFRSIVFPLGKIPVTTFMIISIPHIWNNLVPGLLYLKPDNTTLQAFISNFQGTNSTNYQAIMSSLAISLIPMVIIYLIFQKYFTRGSLAGAIKG